MASLDQMADETLAEIKLELEQLQLTAEFTAEFADGVTDEHTDGCQFCVLVPRHARAINKVWNWLDHPNFGQDPLHIPWTNTTVGILYFRKLREYWTIEEHAWVSWAIDAYAGVWDGGRIPIKTLWEAFCVRFPEGGRTLVAMRSYVQRTRDLRAKRMKYRM
ncbi:hypothetical protein BDY17DRAFT_327221 [Neohortaea acidophila]|uniref:Uncharacterized protein n=1 Tax=Neohortaea acidophila TaxID=245834 RepID=A0A6A6PKQ9_9PEZI|nr:uncharacterized protein BDY17DRAFT_327221 [Neohortaea acidophila]KAF2480254.1 hypothetical protein BDY17DRAFT_327221 [Neohortaea acidophila]